jgi:iron(III) transport system ATP-binding protein
MQITLDSLGKVYEGSDSDNPALSNVSTQIASGEFFFLLGPSGCGKTTLLRLIAGLMEPSAGRILFNEKDVTNLSVDKRNTALVFQGYALWPHMTVLGNVEFGPKMQNLARSERRQLAAEQLTRVQMEDYADRKPNQLSGGQQQRVALARALAARADCLLLDEPLSSLDARLRLHMREELRTLVKSSGMTTVYVTHDQKEALSMADRIAVMRAGEIVQIGTPEELYNRPATRFVADFLGEANFLDGTLTASGDPANVETVAGTVLCSDDRQIKPDTNVSCCIRPEHITIESAHGQTSAGSDNYLPASIVSSMYLGEIRQYTCALAENREHLWRVSMLADLSAGMKEGDEVFLRFSARHIALLER